MTYLDTLRADPTRCTHGYAANQHPRLCPCPGLDSEYATFVAALRTAARADGLIHQTDVRPLIQRIPHKHRGQLYRKARAAGVIEVAGKEPSTDEAGRNLDKDQRIYRLRSAA
jgi:hypothetical protein